MTLRDRKKQEEPTAPSPVSMRKPAARIGKATEGGDTGTPSKRGTGVKAVASPLQQIADSEAIVEPPRQTLPSQPKIDLPETLRLLDADEALARMSLGHPTSHPGVMPNAPMQAEGSQSRAAGHTVTAEQTIPKIMLRIPRIPSGSTVPTRMTLPTSQTGGFSLEANSAYRGGSTTSTSSDEGYITAMSGKSSNTPVEDGYVDRAVTDHQN
jgi:hypothetical protein